MGDSTIKSKVRVSKHVRKQCHNDSCDGDCFLCNNFLCEKCGMIEGSLTTHCPEVDSYAEHWEKVYTGKKDYRGGMWIEGMRNRTMYPTKEIAIDNEIKWIEELSTISKTGADISDLLTESCEELRIWTKI